MKFLNTKHEERFNELMKRGIGVRAGDMERIPAMYILSGNEDLYRKVDKIYDFEEGWFRVAPKCTCEECGATEVEWEVSLSSSQEKLVGLAFDIFSGRSYIGVCELFRVLDKNNVQLALNAISMTYVY